MVSRKQKTIVHIYIICGILSTIFLIFSLILFNTNYLLIEIFTPYTIISFYSAKRYYKGIFLFQNSIIDVKLALLSLFALVFIFILIILNIFSVCTVIYIFVSIVFLIAYLLFLWRLKKTF